MNQITTLPVRAIKAAMNAAANKDIRYYLNGIHVEHCNGVLHVVATDGHMLFACRLPGWKADRQDNWSLIIPLETCKLALKAAGRTNGLALTGEPGRGKACQLGSVSFTSIDGVYPDWRRVTPPLNATFELVSQQYQPTLLLRAYQAIADFDGKSKSEVGYSAFMHRLEDKAVITGQDGQAYCVVMSRRDTDDLHRIRWFQADRPIQAAA